MYAQGLQDNLNHMKAVVRELYIFSNQLITITSLEANQAMVIDQREKILLERAVVALTNQLKILNDSIPQLVSLIGTATRSVQGLSQVNYQPSIEEKVSVVISDKDKEVFLKNLNSSRLSINKLKQEYGVVQGAVDARRPSMYAKISNSFFRNLSINLVNQGYFSLLNKNLRKINSRFVVSTYVSMILFSIAWVFLLSIVIFSFLLFFDVSLLFPFVSVASDGVFSRALRFFWVILAFPIFTGLGMYFYPHSEAKNLGSKINQELPFVAIHLSAIASSGIEPVKMFEIILKGEDYRYTGIEFKKLLNLINFHGEDIVNALRKISLSTSSSKLRELLNGFAVAISSGGNLLQFLKKHSETLLFDYKLERERYTKISETFMDIYISIAIAAPMIMLMIFVIIGGTGLSGGIFNLGVSALSFLLIFVIVLLNVFFLTFLRIKQPAF